MSNQSESLHIRSELGQARVASPAFERELAALLIEALNIEASVDEIDPLDPLYDGPLGLDSIDMLEIALSVSKRYGIQLRADDANNHGIFASLRSLAAHIESHRPAG